MKFRAFKRENNMEGQNSDDIQLITVEDIKKFDCNLVYNVAGYSFNVVANNMIVSSHGESTKDVPEFIYSIGKFIHRWFGVRASRKYYKLFD